MSLFAPCRRAFQAHLLAAACRRTFRNWLDTRRADLVEDRKSTRLNSSHQI